MPQTKYRLDEAIKQWPESDRPREKLAGRGAAFLSDTELLAILIGSGHGKKNAIDLARMLINKFENLAGLESASIDELCVVKGIGFNKAIGIKAALELGRRFSLSTKNVKSSPIRTAEDVYQLYISSMKNLQKEVFSAMLLNSRKKLIKTVTVSEGGLTGTVVHPREVFNVAVRESAHCVILAHNHPSGDTAPSDEDIRLTRRLVDAGKLMGIEVIDHLIVCDDKYYSFADNGEL